MYGNGYGMPSSHSQFVAFFSVYLALFLLFRHVPSSPMSHHGTGFLERVGVSCLAGIAAAIVSVSRIYLNYHTPKQVLAGCGAGVVFAVCWFCLTVYLRNSGWVDWALDTELAQMARLRDLLMSEDFVEAGWQRWNAKRMLKRQVDGDVSRKSI
jgi:dolichyldiphosphatase